MLNRFLSAGNKSDCFGCGMCESRCPVSAITMREDSEGFRYPYADKNICIDCGICGKVCPIEMNGFPHSLGSLKCVVHSSAEVVAESQSGGAFTAFSDPILAEGGTVYGAVLDEKLVCRHIRADRAETRDRMRGSKYVQSTVSKDVFAQMENDLKSGLKVMFTGTPCQCAAVRKAFGSSPGLYIIDFICHGTPSPLIWKEFVNSRRKMFGGIKAAVFRHTDVIKYGQYTESVTDMLGNEHFSNDYAAVFYSHLAQRPSCYECGFASGARYSDITIGGFLDYEHLHIDYSRGASMVFLNTAKGTELFETVKESVVSEDVPIVRFKNQPCLYDHISMPRSRKKFWEEYEKYGFGFVIKKYAANSIKKKFHIELQEDLIMLTEQQEKFNVFKENDLKDNRGLIVNQTKEVETMMNYPAFTECFRDNYLNALLTYATENTEFFRPYANFKSLSDFPVVDKQIMKDHYDEIYVRSFRDKPDNKEKRTSGTTGTPFIVYWDHRKHCRMIADVKFFAAQGGAISHERIVCLVVNEKGDRKPVELQERDNVYIIYCGYFDDASIENILKEANSRRPKSIVGYASMWKAIANYIYDGKASEYEWDLSSVLAEAEAMDTRTKEILEDYFKCPVYSRYGNEENGVLAQEDESGLGHRFNTASYYLEILKLDSDEPAEDGEIGRVVITDMFNYAFPIIRYANGDLAVKHVTEDGKVYLSSVLGRQVDMLYTTDGKPVNWLAGVIFIKKYRDIKQFQIIQETEKSYHWRLNTTNHVYDDIIISESKDIFGQDAEITIEYVDEIPKLRSGKTQMTICKLNKK